MFINKDLELKKLYISNKFQPTRDGMFKRVYKKSIPNISSFFYTVMDIKRIVFSPK